MTTHFEENLSHFFLHVDPFQLTEAERKILETLGIDPNLDPYTLTRELLLAEEKWRISLTSSHEEHAP
jgi:hypothetical protein